LNNKGQSSFEILLIAAVIIILSMTVVSKFFSISDSFTAMAILKDACLEKISSSDVKEFHAIQKIDYSVPAAGKIEMIVYFNPAFVPPSNCPFSVSEVSSLIQSKTKYSTVTISCA